ncbi:DUF5677 domain-containing protein [Sphingomonas sp. PB4P5]|uniref:DUF5677 domain-containing protein n=1 Tax=Parasphingomonas puruogangriensis TaxID=3096155 RepID=UPI002FC8E05E
MSNPNLLSEFANRLLAEAAAARVNLQVADVLFLGAMGVADPGRHFANYANMIFNRIVSLYDDCELLLKNQRIPAACVLARCILETYAVGEFALSEVVKGFNNGGLKKAGETVLAYVNSSRIKVEEQKRLKDGVFSADDYFFTPEAVARMQNEEAVSKHILNAMRNLFKREMTTSSRKESMFEMIYEQLSEWTHPSQTSLFHAFAEDTWLVETRAGKISIWDGARGACGQAMHFITAAPDLRDRMTEAAKELSVAHDQDAAKPTF